MALNNTEIYFLRTGHDYHYTSHNLVDLMIYIHVFLYLATDRIKLTVIAIAADIVAFLSPPELGKLASKIQVNS